MSGAARPSLFLLATLSAQAPTLAIAQSTATQVAVSAGSATDERGVRSNALTFAPSLVLAPTASTRIVLGASATRFENAVWQAGASGSLATRSASADGFAASLSAGASASRASFDVSFAAADATPALEWVAGALTLFGGAHLATGYTEARSPAGPVPLPGQTPLVSQARTSHGPVYGALVRLGSADASRDALLSYREEPMVVAGAHVTDRMAGVTLSLGRFVLAAGAGDRRASDERTEYASGSASVTLSRALSLELAAGRYPSSRLTGAAGGRFLSTGLSLRFGGEPREAHLPEPSGAHALARNATRLSIRAPAATRVEVAGDWSGWEPVPAERADNGVWYADLSLSPGEYRYAFRIDGRAWRVPEGAAVISDGFGGKSAYVTVRGAASQMNHTQEEP